MSTAQPPPFAQRLRLLRNKRNEDWWHIVFGGPVATFLNAFIAEVRWITPNMLTWLSFAAKLAALPFLLLRTHNGDLAAAILLQVNTVLDVMDGSLARYRRAGSYLGAFLDKVTDAIGLVLVGGVLGYRVFVDNGDFFALYAGLFVGVAYVIRCYAFWVTKYHEREVNAPPSLGMVRQDFGDLTFAQRLAYYARSSWRIVLVGEGDVYFWISLALIVGRLRWVVWFLAIASALWFSVILVHRFVQMWRFDRSKAGRA
jgi:phosphatidylglycerophosphate synthase